MSSVKIKEIKSLLYKLRLNIDQIRDLIEERNNLSKLHLEPSTNDNFDLITLFTKTTEYFKLVDDYLLKNKNVEFQDQFDELLEAYNNIYNSLQSDSTIDVSEYKFEKQTNFANHPSNTTTKTVRFKDIPDEEDSPESQMGINQFKPYKDFEQDITEHPQDDQYRDINNHQMFAQHQQTMMRQDQDLDFLHQSISRQNSMGHDINHELDDHIIILNDLEQGVDGSSFRLARATNRINEFRRLARENGSLFTIIILTIILILLLIVLN
ncbi:uncharacterized protein KGF55_002572 [Candida pseudojiufengensis]|uniref:uncharacterized protein n=1 Tax=Candida pseudojiufengensis TaxID=497109 RepID=UPI0022248F6C|nr:uncharacterized protein KGF55_002572 [Candida pseudojiufengensis]KAI5963692.1 hypothetical protein KGF55_002572 [Candida pseudojiufengensis]